jgi:hypothetical protein
MKGVVEKAINYDEDGIDIYFLNGKKKGTTVKVRPRGYLTLDGTV